MAEKQKEAHERSETETEENKKLEESMIKEMYSEIKGMEKNEKDEEKKRNKEMQFGDEKIM